MSLRDEIDSMSPSKSDIGLEPTATKTQLDDDGDSLKVNIKAGKPVDDDTVRQFLIDKGYDPEKYLLKTVRRSEWTMANGELGESTRYVFDRVVPDDGTSIDIAPLLDSLSNWRYDPVTLDLGDSIAYVVGFSDLQVGKMDGDEDPGKAIVDRFTDVLEQSVARWHKLGCPSRVHLSFLGDLVEGFSSQGGNNAWRTPIPLTDQIRLVRQMVMLAVKTYAELGVELSVAAVPGNHGEAVRFGKGVTTYDDSFDTDALKAVAEAFNQFMPDNHIVFQWPEKDERTVISCVAGSSILQAHGDKWNNGKHWEWWQGQGFSRYGYDTWGTDVLFCSHRHFALFEEQYDRYVIQTPAMESKSQWIALQKGVTGNPGITTFTTYAGRVHDYEVLHVAEWS